MKTSRTITRKIRRYLLAVVALSALSASQANALALLPNPVPGDEVAASLAAYAICRIFNDHETCVGSAMAVDPVPSNAIKQIGIGLTYPILLGICSDLT